MSSGIRQRAVPIAGGFAHRKLKRHFSGRAAISRCHWAVNRVGLLVNSCHVVRLVGPLIPKIQRRKSRTLAQPLRSCENREKALYNAHTYSAMTMSTIARE